MYNETYDDYIRSILGYPNLNNNYESEYETEHMYNYQRNELEEYYPEVYRIIYPMVTKVCNNCAEPISREIIENMTDEVYSALEANNEIRQEENRSNTNINSTKEVKTTFKEPINKEKRVENRGEDRQFRNRNLRDLIQILIIRELLGRPRFPGQRPRPPRPPFPGGPGRPPFPPGGPGGPNPRPPIMPRGYEYQWNKY